MSVVLLPQSQFHSLFFSYVTMCLTGNLKDNVEERSTKTNQIYALANCLRSKITVDITLDATVILLV